MILYWRKQSIFSVLFVVALCLTVTMEAATAEATAQKFVFSDTGEIIVLEDLLVAVDLAVGADAIYALDNKEATVYKYSFTGELLGSIGRKGLGPGEFQSPNDVRIVNGRLSVLEMSPTAVYIFNNDQSFSHRVLADGVRIGTSHVILNDTTIIITGQRFDSGDATTGDVAHSYKRSGELIKDFMPVSALVKKYNAVLIFGTYCDADKSEITWCVDNTDYTVFGFDADGTQVKRFSLAPYGFRPINSEKPDDETNVDARREWFSTWDMVLGLHTIADSHLLIEWRDADHVRRVNVINKANGDIESSFAIDGIIGDVDDATESVYIILTPTEDPSTSIRVISFEDIFAL